MSWFKKGPKVDDIRNKRHSRNEYKYNIEVEITFKNKISDKFVFTNQGFNDNLLDIAENRWTTLNSIDNIIYNNNEVFSVKELDKTVSSIIKIYEYEEWGKGDYRQLANRWVSRNTWDFMPATEENLEKYPEGDVE